MATTDSPVALITGGSRGIGFGIAQHLAASGFSLAINGRRPLVDVESALAELRRRGVEAEYFPADVADLDAHAPLIEAIRGRLLVDSGQSYYGGIPTGGSKKSR